MNPSRSFTKQNTHPIVIILATAVMMLGIGQAQVKIPDRFVKSGVNLAINQEMFEQFTSVFDDLLKNLSSSNLNLRIPHLLSLRVEDQSHNNRDFLDLVDWTIESINIRDASFDKKSTNFVLIEPSQKIKMYFSNLNFNLTFVSNFHTNPQILNYTEVRDAAIGFTNISLTIVYQLTIKDETKGLNIKIDQILINGLGSNLNFTHEKDGIFINQVNFAFDIMKDYTMQKINNLLNDFQKPIENAVNKIMDRVNKRYLDAKIVETYTYVPDIRAFFGLIQPPNQQFSPLIFDSFLALQSYGYIYDDDVLNISAIEFENYLPLYLNTDSSTQVFVSEQTVNQALKCTQSAIQNTWQIQKFLNLTCNTANIDKYIPNFNSAFGPNKDCMFEIVSEVPINISFAAGDIYIENNSYKISVLLPDASDNNYRAVTFNSEVRSIIFGFNMTNNLTYYYELKNFYAINFELLASTSDKFTFDSDAFLVKLNGEYKSKIRRVVTTKGQSGHNVPLEYLFDENYHVFWTSFLNNSQLNIKHQYAQLTIENKEFTDYSFFRDTMYILLSELNETIFSNDDIDSTNEYSLDFLYFLGSIDQFAILNDHLPAKQAHSKSKILSKHPNLQQARDDTNRRSRKQPQVTIEPSVKHNERNIVRQEKDFIETLYDNYEFVKKDLRRLSNFLNRVIWRNTVESIESKDERLQSSSRITQIQYQGQ